MGRTHFDLELCQPDISVLPPPRLCTIHPRGRRFWASCVGFRSDLLERSDHGRKPCLPGRPYLWQHLYLVDPCLWPVLHCRIQGKYVVQLIQPWGHTNRVAGLHHGI